MQYAVHLSERGKKAVIHCLIFMGNHMEVEKHDWVTKVSVSEDQCATFNKIQGEILLHRDK